MAFGHIGVGVSHPIAVRPVQAVRLNLNPERLAGEPSLGLAPSAHGIPKPKLTIPNVGTRLKLAGALKLKGLRK